MSWLFSQALVAGYSAGICSDGEPSAQLSVMPTPHKFWRSGKTIDACGLSLFGLTLQVLTEQDGEDVLMSYLADFPVRTSVVQARAQESMERAADYGVKWPALLAKFDRDSSLWKTAQYSLVEGLDEFLETWPRWGSMRSGVCWARNTPDFLTVEIGSGLLPTPSGVNGGKNHTMGRVDEWGGSSNPLRGTVIGSQCLPEFEELVMGWPVMWTELTPFETDKFRGWRQQHLSCLLDAPDLDKEAA